MFHSNLIFVLIKFLNHILRILRAKFLLNNTYHKFIVGLSIFVDVDLQLLLLNL